MAWNLELGAVRQSTDLVLRTNVLQHILGVVVLELVGGILTRVLQQDLAATRVLVEPLSDIVDVTLDNHPGRVLFEGVRKKIKRLKYVRVVCCFTSSIVNVFDMVMVVWGHTVAGQPSRWLCQHQ